MLMEAMFKSTLPPVVTAERKQGGEGRVKRKSGREEREIRREVDIKNETWVMDMSWG